jgi:hypothetical protein
MLSVANVAHSPRVRGRVSDEESLSHTHQRVQIGPCTTVLGAGDTVLGGLENSLTFVLQLLNVYNTIAQERGFQDTSSLFLSPLPKSPAH